VRRFEIASATLNGPKRTPRRGTGDLSSPRARVRQGPAGLGLSTHPTLTRAEAGVADALMVPKWKEVKP
jgi:hypothetical protein